MRKKLTSTLIKRVKNPSTGRIAITDSTQKGLVLFVTPTSKSFYFQGRVRGTGKVRQIKIGYFPDISLEQARETAQKYLAQARQGNDPALGLKAFRYKALSLKALTDQYLELHAKPNKSKKAAMEDERQINRYILPVLGEDMPIGLITRQHLISLLDAIGKRAPVQANRTRALISKIFNFAIQRGLLETSPVTKLPRYTKEFPRDRVLSPEEIRTFWFGTAQSCSRNMAHILRLLLLTAQRKSEVLAMRWEEIDFEAALWTLPASKTKNHRPQIVPLSTMAIAILKARAAIFAGSTGFVFSSNSASGHITSTGRLMTKFRQRTGLNLRVHDLRRTAATNLAALGCPQKVLKLILNHTSTGDVTAIYDQHAYLIEKAAYLQKWSDRLESILTKDQL